MKYNMNLEKLNSTNVKLETGTLGWFPLVNGVKNV